MNTVNAEDAYRKSFGGLSNETVYVDTLGSHGRTGLKSDLRTEFNNIVKTNLKALTTDTGSGSTDKVMIPLYVDPKVVDLTRKQTPIVDIIPRVSNMGRTAEYNSISAKGGAFFAIEDASLNETDTTFTRGSTAIKYMYSVGRTTGQAQAAQPGFNLMGFQPQGGPVGTFADAGAPNANQLNVLVKARELRELEEDSIINGDAATNTEEYSGIVTLMSTTNTVAKSGTSLDLEDINLAVQYAYVDGGLPNVAICDAVTFTKLLDLLSAKIGYLQAATKTEFGFTAVTLNTMVGSMQVIPSRYLSTTAAAQSMYILDLSIWEMRVLQDMTFERLAKNNDSDKFMIKMYEALICRATQFNASITGMTN